MGESKLCQDTMWVYKRMASERELCSGECSPITIYQHIILAMIKARECYAFHK